MKLSTGLMTIGILAITAAVPPAFSQQFIDRGGSIIGAPRAPGSIMVQTTLSISVPADAGKDMREQTEDAQKTFYQMAAGQCALVLETIADDCQITAMNNNTDFNRNVKNEIFIRGSVSMAVKLKASSVSKP
jgi:hypothetical protein